MIRPRIAAVARSVTAPAEGRALVRGVARLEERPSSRVAQDRGNARDRALPCRAVKGVPARRSRHARNRGIEPQLEHQLDRLDLLERILAEDPSRVHERGGDGQTPLHFARSRRVVDLLLAAGADADARDVDHRSTPAQWMIGSVDEPEESRTEVAKYLVERGASVDIFLAAALGLTDRVRSMLETNRSLLELRTGQGEYAEKPPSSYHIYLWTIGANLTPLQTAARFKQRETLGVMRGYASPEQRLLLACHACIVGVRAHGHKRGRALSNS